MKKIIALLPMKGTSERVPNKNLKLFNGKPLYHHVMETLLRSKFIDLIVVNTDSPLLKADILLNFKERVKVVDRDPAVCGNYISMNKVLEQDITVVNSEIYLQTHSTNPLLKAETIDKAIEKMQLFLKTKESDSVFAVSKTQKRFYNKDATPMNHNPKMLVTQHLEPIFEENSCFYLFTKQGFLNTESRIGKTPFMYEIDKIEATDIDEPEDFIIAEALHKLLR
jgi:CMP-N-acetylneuraminic acid synthetase